MDVYFSRISNSLAFSAGAFYYQLNYESTKHLGTSLEETAYADLKLAYHSLNIPLSVKYVFLPQKKLSPYLHEGTYFAFLFEKENSDERYVKDGDDYRKYYSERIMKEEGNKNIESFSFVCGGGLVCNLRNSQANRLETKYLLGTNISKLRDMSVTPKGLNFSVGYEF